MRVLTNDGWIEVAATMMTSEAIGAYGGIRFGHEVLARAAEDLNSGRVPMHVEHDQTRPLRVRALRAIVVQRGDGVHLLQATYEVHPDDAHFMETLKGMSVAIRAPLASREGNDSWDDDSSDLSLSADHAWFADDVILEGADSFASSGLSGPVNTQRVYQFSFVPDPQIFVTIGLPALQAIVLGAAGSALWDGIKRLLRGRRTPPDGDPQTPTRINVEVTAGGRSLVAAVETSSKEVAERAINALSETLRDMLEANELPGQDAPSVPALGQEAGLGPSEPTSGTILLWDDASRSWVPRVVAVPPAPDA